MTNTVSDLVSDEELNAIIQIESAGNPRAKAATSTALGLGQFLNATWLAVVQKHRPDLMSGRSRAQILALRTDPSIAVELLARFTEDNRRAIGIDCAPGDLYLAHFLGVSDARDLFRAAPGTPVARLVSSAAIAANRSILENKTAGQVRAWAARKMAKKPAKDWVSLYYSGAAPPVLKQTDPDPAANGAKTDAAPPEVEAGLDPVPPVKPAAPSDDTEKVVLPKEAGGFFPWLVRVIKNKITWAGTAIGGISLASILDFITDWRTITALIGLIVVCYLIYRFGRK